MKSHWNKWLAQPGHIRTVSIEATELIRQLSKQQGLTGLAQAGFGEAVIGSLLIASAHKSSESINMNAQGSGLYKQAIIDASPEGKVRGFLREQKDRSMHTFGASGMNGPWGSGILSILYTKNFEGKYPYTGMVPISTGFLDDAINEYYRDSEQLVSKVGLFIEMDGQEILAARGALVQALGGATEEELDDINELDVKQLRHLASTADNQSVFKQEMRALLQNREFSTVENREIIGFCNCSQERIERALTLTGESEIKEALGQDPFMTIVCDFCRKEYRISAERVKSLFSSDPSRLQ